MNTYLDFNKKNEGENVIPMMNDSLLISPIYLTKLFSLIILWSLIIIFFIWLIDPYGVSPLNINLPHVNTYKSKRIDIDRLIKPYEVWRYQPRTIFLGTSRIHQSIDPSVLGESNYAPAYNASIPASTLAENTAYIEQFLKLDHHIKNIFIELFFYNFTYPTEMPHVKTWREFFSNYTSLQMSSSALIDAIKTVSANKKKGPRPPYVAKGGFRVYGSDFNPASTFSEALFTRTVISWDRAGKTSLYPDSFKILDRLVALAKKHDIKLHLLLTPNYPWDDYRLLSLGYWNLLEEWMRKLAHYPNVASFSQYNELLEEPPTMTPKMKWWNDPIHFSQNMGRLMILSYLGKSNQDTPANFMRIITPSTVESVIRERHAGLLKWAAAHPDFVKNFEEAKKSTPDKVKGTLNITDKVLLVNDRNYPVVLGVGEASYAKNEGKHLTVIGWAIDETIKQNVEQLISTIGTSVVATGFVTAKNPDLALALDNTSILNQFVMEIPLISWDGSQPIRIFALMKDGRAVQLTSQSPLIDGTPAVNSLGNIQGNTIIIGNKTYPIKERIAGSIEGAKPLQGGYYVQGWAVDIKANNPVVAIIATLGSSVVSKGFPTCHRDDIIQAFASGAKLTGFSMNVPLPSNQSKSQVQLFALMADGVASPLACNLEKNTRGLFKKVAFPNQ